MTHELRILASLTIDLGVASQSIDMSAYPRYVVTGYAYDHLAIPITSGFTPVHASNGGALFDFSLNANVHPEGNYVPLAGPSPIKAGGDIAIAVGATLRPGNTVVLHIFGTDLS